MSTTKINIVHVPYKGTSPAEADLMAGQISLMLDTTTCLPLIAGGKLRALAVASKKRNPALPDVPTFAELGMPIYASSWRSEEHTSELQSLMRISYAVFCLKKKNK